jgi:hypothetical protein
MNLLKLPTAYLLAIIASLFLGACASGDSPSGSPQEIAETQSQLLGEMPLPQGARILGQDSLIIGRGDNWVGRVQVAGLQGATDIYAFFQSEYPKAGWTTVAATKAKVSILVFTKGDRTVTVEVSDGPFSGPKSLMTITASPKNANVYTPPKK